MFSTLRQNSELYMLDKSRTPTLKIGKVLDVKPTRPFYTNPLDSTLTIVIDAEGETINFELVPSNLTKAVLGNTVIAETKELMCQEVENMIVSSRQIIDSIDYHKEVITSCEDILKRLNPQIAKEKAQEDKINNLETKISGMEVTMSDIKTMLSKVLDK